MRSFQYIHIIVLLFTIACSPQKTSERNDSVIHFSISDSLKLGMTTELLYYNDEYHLFYQCENADKITYWGHSKSANLITWNHYSQLIKAENNHSIGAGSVVIDYNNTSGLGKDNTPMVAIYADSENNKGQKVSIAYSNDEGANWIPYNNNPVVINNGLYPISDPKVIWHEETQRWVMLVVAGYQVEFYGSNNLLDWEYLSEFNKIYEEKGEWINLEFLQVNVDETGKKKWVLFITGDQGSPNTEKGTRYFAGDFDGYSFIPYKSKGLWLDSGTDTYAGVGTIVYSSQRETTAFVGCMTNHNTDYTSPRNITLKKKYNNYYLVSKPLITPKNNSKVILIDGKKFKGKVDLDAEFKLPVTLDLSYELNNRKYLDFAEVYGIILTNSYGDKLTVGYHNMKRYFFISSQQKDKKNNPSKLYYTPYIIDASQMDIKLMITKSSVELFVMDGFLSMTQQFTLTDELDRIQLFSEGGKIELIKGKLTEL